jgi:hypothetical protein
MRVTTVLSLAALAGLLSWAQLVEVQPLMMTGKAKADEIAKGVRAPSLPPPRDPSVAIAEEYEFARRKGTAEALELFIARHDGDPLAQKLRAELRRLSR